MDAERYAAKSLVRFWAKVDKTADCWIWGGALTNGYGRFVYKIDDQLTTGYAHRFSYELVNPQIPGGMYLDHTCHNRACVNSEHLRLVTTKQNNENKLIGVDNSSGLRGVSWDPRRKKWRAGIGHNGQTINLGRYASLAEAEAAVVARRNELFTHNDADRTV